MKDTLACLIRRLKLEGYCTLFLIKIDLWSRGGLPIDRSPWSMDQGLVVRFVELVACNFVYKYS